MILKTFINTIRNFGVNNQEDILEQKRTMLLNEISLFLAFMVLLYIPQAFVENVALNLTLIAFSELAVIIPIWLNSRNKIISARWFFCVVDITLVMLMILVYGLGMRFDFILLLYGMISIIFFTKGWQRIFLLIYIVVLQAFAIYYTSNYPTLGDTPNLRYIEVLTFAFVNIGVVVIIGRYISVSTLIETNLMFAIRELDTKSQILHQNQTQIQEQNLKLEAANQELEKFAYIASHDLKSPLRGVNSFLKLIKRKVQEQDNPEVLKEVDAAVLRAEQMNFLIQDILDFSKIGIDEEISEINLNEILKVLQEDMEENLLVIKPQICIDKLLPTIRANPKQIFILFNHLIENGLLYNDSEIPSISINYSIDEQHIIFTFKDNGFGIAKKNQEVVFEMFKRLHTQDQYKGSGVGLAVCKKIVERYDGQIELFSQLHQSTTITVKFPKIMFIAHN